MKKLATSLGLVACGVVLAVPLFLGTMKAMVDTSTPEFCGSCHEIAPAVEAWRGSTHVNNAQGLVASCMDCHLPSTDSPAEFAVMKTYHGLKDVSAHLLDGPEEYDRTQGKLDFYAEVSNEPCLRCHKNVLTMATKRGAMLAHRSVIYPRPGYEKKCVDCHWDLVHSRQGLVMFKSEGQPYQAKGLRPDLLGRPS